MCYVRASLIALVVLALAEGAGCSSPIIEDSESRHVDAGSSKGQVRPPKDNNISCLGITASQISKALGKQLELPSGTGLLVDSIDPDSPAHIQEHDTLIQLDSQILVNAQQLQVLLGRSRPGLITITLIRKGHHMTVPIKLTEKGTSRAPTATEAMIEFEHQTSWNLPATVSTSLFSVSDHEHKLYLTAKNHQLHVTVTDKTGKEIYSGLVQTGQQRDQLSSQVRGKLEAIEKSLAVNGNRIIVALPRPGKTVRHIEAIEIRMEAGKGHSEVDKK